MEQDASRPVVLFRALAKSAFHTLLADSRFCALASISLHIGDGEQRACMLMCNFEQRKVSSDVAGITGLICCVGRIGPGLCFDCPCCLESSPDPRVSVLPYPAP